MIKHIVLLCKHQDSAAKDYETTPYWHTWALLFLHWLVLALDSVNVLQTCSYWNPDLNCNNNYWACHTSNGKCRKLNWNIIILIARLVLFSDDMYITNYITNIGFLFENISVSINAVLFYSASLVMYSDALSVSTFVIVAYYINEHIITLLLVEMS
mgnify:CR=1 FL=1